MSIYRAFVELRKNYATKHNQLNDRRVSDDICAEDYIAAESRINALTHCELMEALIIREGVINESS